jgi:hypothetical protein
MFSVQRGGRAVYHVRATMPRGGFDILTERKPDAGKGRIKQHRQAKEAAEKTSEKNIFGPRMNTDEHG